MRIAIIGAGAAGCFCAIQFKRVHPDYEVHVFEAGAKALAKVAITGGGRCNLTNASLMDDTLPPLAMLYPRGDKLMRRALNVFSASDTWNWFEAEGVPLVVQEDGCVFPKSQNALDIVATLLRQMRQTGVQLHLNSKVTAITPVTSEESNERYTINTNNKDLPPRGLGGLGFEFSSVIVTIGGKPKTTGFDLLTGLDLKIESPVPSLFAFNTAAPFLSGTVVDDVSITLCGTKFRSSGTLLLTHFGMSGPAILRLSSYAARHLAENDYQCKIAINWCGDRSEEEVRSLILDAQQRNQKKQLSTVSPFPWLTTRLWQHLVAPVASSSMLWNGLSQKHINRLVSTLTADMHEVTGRCPFKEEFVTCGGVSLKSVNINTLECRDHKGLYFAGEALDVDAITGGYNLQAAWSMAMVIAQTL